MFNSKLYNDKIVNFKKTLKPEYLHQPLLQAGNAAYMAHLLDKLHNRAELDPEDSVICIAIKKAEVANIKSPSTWTRQNSLIQQPRHLLVQELVCLRSYRMNDQILYKNTYIRRFCS